MSNLKGCFMSNSDDCYTPIDFFDKLNDEFHFTLDPCGCPFSDVSNKIGFFYDKNSDGFCRSWGKNICFVNPPYSQISDWVFKCFVEWSNGATVVLLIPVRTDTRYFHKFIYPYAKLRFIPGRLKFSNSKNSAPFPSMLCIFDHQSVDFDNV